MSVIRIRLPRVSGATEFPLSPISHYAGARRRVLGLCRKNLQSLGHADFVMVSGSHVASQFFAGFGYRDDVGVYIGASTSGPFALMGSCARVMVLPGSSISDRLRHTSALDQSVVQAACAISNLVAEPETALCASPSFLHARSARVLRLNLHRFYREAPAGRAHILIRCVRRILVTAGIFEGAADIPHGPFADPSCIRGGRAADWGYISTTLELAGGAAALPMAFEIARSRVRASSPRRRCSSARQSRARSR